MSNREYISSLSSEELAKYAYRLVMERVGFSYTGSIQEITNWLDREHTSQYDKENFISWN